MADDRSMISNLITFIGTTQEESSVTNEIVARVLEALQAASIRQDDVLGSARAVSGFADPGYKADYVTINYDMAGFDGQPARRYWFSVSGATETSAGVMTASQVSLLEKLGKWREEHVEWLAEYDPATVADNASEGSRAWNAIQGRHIDNQEVYDIIGDTDGICPLDESRRVAERHLPVATLGESGILNGTWASFLYQLIDGGYWRSQVLDQFEDIWKSIRELGSGSSGGDGCGCGAHELMTSVEGIGLALEILNAGSGVVDEPEPPGLTEEDFLSFEEASDLVDRIFD